jgi:hypothetical protein
VRRLAHKTVLIVCCETKLQFNRDIITGSAFGRNEKAQIARPTLWGYAFT